MLRRYVRVHVAVAAYVFAALDLRAGRHTNLYDALRIVDYTDLYGVRLQFYEDGTSLAYFNITNLRDGEFQSIGQWSSTNGGQVHVYA